MTDDISIPPNGSFSFVGRTALVTGGARGVGAAVVRELHAGGGKVAVTDLDLDEATRVAEALDPSGATAFAIRLDVREKADFEGALAAVVDRWGKLDIVVNNAGLAKRTPTAEITPEEFDEICRINMRSVFLSCQVLADHMVANGYGRIVNITSLAGQNGGTVASPHYAASKAGANMLTKYFARHLAGTGVTVNGVCPGPIESSKVRMTPEMIARVESEVPIGRFMTVGEIAAATALLASDRGGFFMGATLDMNGGLYLR
ncbi:SDR family NAD(P)-dependent oxidoreductase [Sphingomonas naphthae]|uniref:SDR family NAD(P)-dependent oxidoreductase n=1 Tax=Sphingomonas naphthae TaxID=1813468 RepID=A0ABY7TKM2_9SPHN|nr:SDR family NAD(P)-dependent oxidoreductase [Sphingomonas naphthae]WCT73786.1 SDR family NAD(P)-dependent oxidoreductase [Sphingomonas naphthae]